MIKNNGSLKGYPDCDEFEENDPLSYLEREVQYLITSAFEKVINKVNATKTTLAAERAATASRW